MAKAKSRGTRIVIVISVVIALVVAVFLLLPSLFPEKTVELLDRRGEVQKVFFVQDESLEGVVVIEEVEYDSMDGPSFSATKFSVFDLKDGNRVAMLAAEQWTGCMGITGGLLWCFHKERGLHGRSPISAEVVYDEKTLTRDNTELVGKLNRQPGDYELDPEGERLLIKTNEGFRFWLDATTRKVHRAPDDANIPPRSYSPTTSWSDNGSGESLAMTGPDRRRIKGPGGESTESFLHGEFLVDQVLRKPIRFTGPDSFCIAHWSRMREGNQKEGLILSRVEPGGKILWSTPGDRIFAESKLSTIVVSARLTPHGLFLLARQDEEGKLFLFDPENGSVRWQTAL